MYILGQSIFVYMNVAKEHHMQQKSFELRYDAIVCDSNKFDTGQILIAYCILFNSQIVIMHHMHAEIKHIIL